MSGPFDLTGRLAVVTGASRGIGRACAAALAAAGADVIGVATAPPDGEVADEVRATGRRYEALGCDFTDATAVAALGDALAGRDVDVLVNNAGTIRRAPAAGHPQSDFDLVVQVNLTSQFTLTQRVGASMLARGHGKVVFTASLLSFQGGVNVPGYTASKHAVAGLTRALANEWAPHGVNVNAVAPGYVVTDNTAALRADPDRSRALLERIPAGRWAVPEDVAGPVVFLASPAADYVHGVVLAADGGWLAR
ncbi:SDR family oxidoreductase [Kineococcus sp. SYSU DK003]|uniref:SDR family oxidoreductase n=1 Tax=Kineococcus sp. SYSU DK003 TaxID=3383124 RepID=UPI003D7CC770